MTDSGSNPATVELLYQLPGEAMPRRMDLDGRPNPVVAMTSPNGVTHAFDWDFEAAAGMPGDGSYVEGVRLLARIVDAPGQSEVVRFVDVGLGNDEPTIGLGPVTVRDDGIVTMSFNVADSSDDLVDVAVGFSVDGGATWLPARPVGLGSLVGTPVPTFVDVSAPRAGSPDISFAWDTNHPTQLAQVDRDVTIRLTPHDGLVAGDPVFTDAFRINNNAEPTVSIDQASFALNTDGRRGVPIRYEVDDEEGDPVRVLFQWRREGEDFVDVDPALGPEEILAKLEDSKWVAEHRVCVPFPRFARGDARGASGTVIRLPELSGEESWILQQGVEGREIEFLRGFEFSDITAGWSTQTLTAPVAALPERDGRRLLVLDRDFGNGVLLEVDGANGSVVRAIASSIPGEPVVMARDLDRRRVLVVTASKTDWTLWRIDLDTRGSTELITVAGTPPRAIASLGDTAALATAGSSLLRLDWLDADAPTSRAVLGEFATPWGIAVDPHDTRRVFVAERDAVTLFGIGRIVEIDLLSTSVTELRSGPSEFGGSNFPYVTSIVFRPRKNQLLAVCERSLGFELRQLDFGKGAGRVRLVGSLGPHPTALAATEGEFMVACADSASSILASGGVSAQRRILAFDARTSRATLDLPMSSSGAWRIAAARSFRDPILAGDGPRTGTMLWDTTAVTGGGSALIRATAFDSDRGPMEEPGLARGLFAYGTFTQVVAADSTDHWSYADFDDDGDLDFVGVVGGSIVVVPQIDKRSFGPEQVLLTTPFQIGGLLVEDLDANGLADLIVRIGAQSFVHFQIAPGVLAADPITLAGTVAKIVDLDGDRDLDLLMRTDLFSSNTSIHVAYQTAFRQFEAHPDEWQSGSRFSGLQFDDMDGDGIIDWIEDDVDIDDALAVGIRRGSDDGGFSEDYLRVGVTGNIGVRGDIDGDGQPDFVIGGGFGNVGGISANATPVNVARRTDGGGYVEESLFGPLPNPTSDLQDFNGDGVPELMTDGVLLGREGSTYASYRILDDQSEPLGGAMLDVDADGLVDVVNGGRVQFQRHSTATSISTLALSGSTALIHELVAADLDGDGDLDLAGLADGAGILVFPQVTAGGFAATPRVVEIAGARELFARDLDGDARVDLVVVSSSNEGSEIRVYWQEDLGVFDDQPHVIATTDDFSYATAMTVGDFDGDGSSDVFVTLDDDVVLCRQTNTRSFESTLFVQATTAAIRLLEPCDLDGDGTAEVLSFDDGGVARLLELGLDGELDSIGVDLPGLNPGLVSFAIIDDLDRDGSVELITANTFGDTVLVFRQDGPRSFQPDAQVLGGSESSLFPLSAALVDIDWDGDRDLVASTVRGAIGFYQLSPGRFDPRPVLLSGVTTEGDTFQVVISEVPTSLESSDLDGDGDDDVFFSTPDGQIEIRWGGQ
ncbi:MAG: VCBS repeat-containing protein [Planctomycetes bacterium]|nr:VCBS repeat-containing protein [Planctomycetota bacterium]